MKPIPSVLAAPWAIEPRWLRVVFGVWSRGQIDATALAAARADWEARRAAGPQADEAGPPVAGTGGTLRIVGNVGVLGIEGPLFRHANILTDFSGGTTYDSLGRGLEAAIASSQVQAILLRVSSPGGECDGLNELAKAIAAAGERKLVWAYADNMMASAAYWLGSQAAHIVAEETAEIGSIGVRCGLLDDSKADEMMGLREIEIISSASPGKRSRPVDDEVIARLQMRVDDLANIFIDAVAQGRAVDRQVVLADFGQGDVLIAAKALAAGMADEMGNFNGTLSALAAAALTSTPAALAAARATRGANMQTKKQPAATAGSDPATAASDDKTCSNCGAQVGAKAFCLDCYNEEETEPKDDDEQDEETKALAAFGLLGKTRSQTRAKLAAFARDAITAVCSNGAPEALGKIRGGAQAVIDLQAVRASMMEAARADKAKAWKASIASSLGALGGMGLGTACKVVPSFIQAGAERQKVQAALEALPTATAEGVLAALCLADADALNLEGLQGFLQTTGAGLPRALNEPPTDQKNLALVAISPEDARRFGLTVEQLQKYGNLKSVADLPRPQKGV